MGRTGNEKLDNRDILVPVKAETILAENTIAVIGTDGYAVPGAKAVGLIAAGRVEKLCDNSTGADGQARAQVRRGTFVWDNDGSIRKTDLLKKCYIMDATTVGIAAEGASAAGTILAVDDDGVTVDMTMI